MKKTMKAIGYYEPHPASDPHTLVDLELPVPEPGARDLRVRVNAVSVNPVDTKVRRNRTPKPGIAEVLGWDAVGIVEAVGHEVAHFSVGDRVWYAGSITRPGCNSEFHLVDERLASRAPNSLDDAHAAALPLTAITAWELLFDHLRLVRSNEDAQATLLVTAGAGGVGSILLQLARKLTGAHIVATASRPESKTWALEHGAHAVMDHTQPLTPQLAQLNVPPVRWVASLSNTPTHFDSFIEMLTPRGQLALIDDFAGTTIDVMRLKAKSLSLHWEMMFTRSMYSTPDMSEQGKLLGEVARLVDTGTLRSTATEVVQGINATHLRRTHELVEAGHTLGKRVLHGFGSEVR